MISKKTANLVEIIVYGTEGGSGGITQSDFKMSCNISTKGILLKKTLSYGKEST